MSPQQEKPESPLAGCFRSLATAFGVAAAVVLICLAALWAVGWGAS